MSKTDNAWEADPWNASDEIADRQFNGFKHRAALPLVWKTPSEVPRVKEKRFGMDDEGFSDLDVEFCAVHGSEDYLLMRLIWHGFPDPPEWRLATRVSGNHEQPWEVWGYFADLPIAWEFPKENNAPNQ